MPSLFLILVRTTHIAILALQPSFKHFSTWFLSTLYTRAFGSPEPLSLFVRLCEDIFVKVPIKQLPSWVKLGAIVELLVEGAGRGIGVVGIAPTLGGGALLTFPL